MSVQTRLPGDKPVFDKRGETRLQSLTHTKEFRDFIKWMRHGFLPHGEGFPTAEAAAKWFDNPFSQPRMSSFIKRGLSAYVVLFLKENGLPINHWWRTRITEKILGHDAILHMEVGARAYVEVRKISWKYGGRVDVVVYDGASQQDVVDFVQKNWGLVEPPTYVGGPKRIRSAKDPKIDALIVELMEKRKDELPGTGKYKEQRVAAAIKNLTGVVLSTEAVRIRYLRRRRGPKGTLNAHR